MPIPGGTRNTRRALLTEIQIPERGYTDVPPELWQKLAAEQALWSLVRKKLLRVSQPSRTVIRLEGTSFVGRASVGDLRLELVEKVPGALSGLLRAATNRAFRVERMEAPATPPGRLVRILVGEFLKSVQAYSSQGRRFAYKRVPRVSSLVGGKIVMSETVKLRSRGLGHLVAFEQNSLDYAIPKNRVVAAALMQLLNLAEAWEVPARDIFTGRLLDELFTDCKDTEVLFGLRRRFSEYADVLVSLPDEEHRDMLRLASVLLASESIEPAPALPRDVPRTWFLNLETLFETSVRLSFRRSSGLTVTKPSGAARRAVFPEEGLLPISPDLLVTAGEEVVAVGDVKYKNAQAEPEASDLYQLLVHATVHEAQAAFLVFPGDAHNVTRLGLSATGVTVWLVVLDVRRVDEGIPALLQEMGIGMAAA